MLHLDCLLKIDNKLHSADYYPLKIISSVCGNKTLMHVLIQIAVFQVGSCQKRKKTVHNRLALMQLNLLIIYRHR